MRAEVRELREKAARQGALLVEYRRLIFELRRECERLEGELERLTHDFVEEVLPK